MEIGFYSVEYQYLTFMCVSMSRTSCRIRISGRGGGMTTEKVNFSQFCDIFNLKLTQLNMISPRASGAKKVAMHGTDGNLNISRVRLCAFWVE